MDKITFTVTIAFAVARKRKIFEREEVKKEFIRISNKTLSEISAEKVSYEFLPYGVAITMILPVGISPDEAAKKIKRSTTATIRNMFPEYNAMHALWTRKTWWKEGCLDQESRKEAARFFDYQSSL